MKVTKTTPAKAYSQVSYKSSNKKIATVNAKGKVTAKAVGKATITVQNDSNKKAKAVCKIVVVPTSVPTATNIPVPSEEAVPTGSGISGTVTPVPTSGAEDTEQTFLYSGSYEQTLWTINGKGHLEVNGTGDMWENGSKPEWLQYSDKILSAEIKVSGAKNASGMFTDCERLKTITLSNFDTSKITNMGYMFYGCDSLQKIECEEFITSEVTNMRYMFYGCSSLTELDLHSFDVSNVTSYMATMLSGCRNLRVIKTPYKSGTQKCNLVGIWKDIEGKQYNILPQNATASIVLNWIQPTATPTPTATLSPTATPSPRPTATTKPTTTEVPGVIPTIAVSPENLTESITLTN